MKTEHQLRESIKELMYDNLKANYSVYLKTDYCYVMPSPTHYPFQWWWDTCFNVIILCHLKEFELAKRNLASLFAMQEENGYVGHMIFWESILPKDKLNILQGPPTFWRVRPHMSSLIQPPLVAQALQHVVKSTGDHEFLRMMLPKLKNYFRWLGTNRDLDGDGLISIIATFESGLDWKPSFDEVIHGRHEQATERFFWKVISIDFRNFIRGYNLKKIYKANYFVVKEVLVNTMYAYDLKVLAELCEEAGDPEGRIFLSMSERAAKRISEVMYDEETTAFYDVYGKENKKSKVLTFTIGLPILLDSVSKETGEQIIRNHYFNANEFDLPYPIPSVAKGEPSFSPYESKFLWRGPTWALNNWLIHRCYLKCGFVKEAHSLVETTLKLIDQGGFREYYNPFTGEGYGARNFTWSGLILDMMAQQRLAG